MIKSSTELIQHYDAECQRLEEKATPFNLYLEGYFEGMNDTKEYLTSKALSHLESVFMSLAEDDNGAKYLMNEFKKAMEEIK